MMKKIVCLLLAMMMAFGLAGSVAETDFPGAVEIVLSDGGVTVDGAPASTDKDAAVYTARDIVFYLEGQGFTYGEGTEADAHSQAEADAHTVVHITRPGAYVLSGQLNAGQVAVEIDDAKKDPSAVVTLVLNGVDITCTVAPAVIFYNVYECSSKDEDDAVKDVDTSAAGANVIIADGTVNNINGSYVARIYEPSTVELNKKGTKVKDAEKLHKYDAAFYSKRTMNISGGEKGDGVLNIVAENEGLGSELHLTLNGGIVNITSGNDGINTNEDNVSVTTVNGGSLTINVAGWTGEGDGIDSNGWLVINGGTVTSAACGFSMDAGIDSDKGIWLNGGELMASGNMFDHIAGGDAPYAVFSFSGRQQGGATFTLKDETGAAVAEWTPANDFSYLVVSGKALVPGSYTLWQGDTQYGATGNEVRGFGGFGGGRPPELPEGMEWPEGLPEDMKRPDGPPEDMKRPDVPPEGSPEEMKRPEGVPPQGFGGGRGHGGPGFGGSQDAGEWNGTFVIGEGGSTFSGVSPQAE